jgi:flavin reductase (DIM6/NTAB) family NADH-FMN oxidoreductase RutF
VLVCIDYRCSYLPFFRSSAHYGINILQDGQLDLSVRFATMTGDRFQHVEWHRGETGVPLLAGCLASLECAVSQTVEAGDHAILIGEVLATEVHDGTPLLYYGSRYRALAEDG